MTTTPGHGPFPDGVAKYMGSCPLGMLIIEALTHTASHLGVPADEALHPAVGWLLWRRCEPFGPYRTAGGPTFNNL